MVRKKPIVAVCGALLFAVSGYAQDTPIRPFKVTRGQKSPLLTSGDASTPRDGPKKRLSPINRRASARDDAGLARYWAKDYDWRKCEAKLNALPHSLPRSMGWTSISFTFVRR